MKKEKTTEEILAQIEIDKINARSAAKEIASKHLGKHAINYITVLVVIGVISSTHLEGGANCCYWFGVYCCNGYDRYTSTYCWSKRKRRKT